VIRRELGAGLGRFNCVGLVNGVNSGLGLAQNTNIGDIFDLTFSFRLENNMLVQFSMTKYGASRVTVNRALSTEYGHEC